MPIQVSCPSCGNKANAPDSVAGKKGKCRKCGGVVEIGIPAAAHPPRVALDLASSSSASPASTPPAQLSSATGKPSPVAPVRCENCDRPLGKLEKPIEWNGNSVCLTCYQTLQGAADLELWKSDAAAKAEVAASPPALPTNAPIASRRPTPIKNAVLGCLALPAVIIAGLLCGEILRLFGDESGASVATRIGEWIALVGCIGVGTAIVAWSKKKRHPVEPSVPQGSQASTLLSGRQAKVFSATAIVRGVVLIIVVVVLGAMTAVWVGNLTSEWNEWLCVLSVLTVIALALVMIAGVLHHLHSSRCGACKYFGMAVVTSTQHLGSEETVETRQERVDVRSGPFQDGRIIANFNVPIQERFVWTYTQEFCACQHCGHQWSRRRASRRKA